MSCEKVGQGQRLCNCVNSLIFGGLPTSRGDGWEGGCEIVLIDFNPAYVVAKFELAKCLVEKVGQGQRLCNCVNCLIFGRLPTGRGTDGKGVVKLF